MNLAPPNITGQLVKGPEMKIKVRDASGPVLDWMVAKCEGGYDPELVSTYGAKTAWQFTFRDEEPGQPDYIYRTYLSDYSPSTDWALGGAFIEQGHVAVSPALLVGTSETGRDVCQVVGWKASKDYNAHLCRYRFEASGPTPLIAAMRCYVASKLGEEVGIPEELV